MKKNENGIPCFNLSPRSGGNDMQDKKSDERIFELEMREAPMGNNRQRQKEGCSKNDGSASGNNGYPVGSCDEAPLAYVYAPMQKFCMLYSADEALNHGTLFENLYKPLGVYGNE